MSKFINVGFFIFTFREIQICVNRLPWCDYKKYYLRKHDVNFTVTFVILLTLNYTTEVLWKWNYPLAKTRIQYNLFSSFEILPYTPQKDFTLN